MKAHANRLNGITLIELLTVIAIIAALAAIGVTAYNGYTDRARSVEIVEMFHAQRVAIAAGAQGGVQENCSELEKNFDASKLRSSYATLSLGFEAVARGYRPVLNVCAKVDQHGMAGVNAARRAHESLAKSAVVEKNPVLFDSVVSFALRLTDGEQALCRTATSRPASACSASGGPVATQLPAQGSAQVPSQVPPQAQVPPQVQLPPQAQLPPQVQSPPQVQVPPQPQVPPQRPVQVPAQVSGQGPGQGSVKPPAGNSGTGTANANPQRPPAQTLDAAQLATDLQSIPAMDFLNKRDKETVAATATQMAIDPSYAQVVRDALNKAPPRQAVQIPTSRSGITTIRFFPEMRDALEVAYIEGARRLCIARNGPGYPYCG